MTAKEQVLKVYPDATPKAIGIDNGHEQGTFVLLSNWCIPTGVNYVSNYGEVIQITNNTYLTTTGNIHTKSETHVQP